MRNRLMSPSADNFSRLPNERHAVPVTTCDAVAFDVTLATPETPCMPSRVPHHRLCRKITSDCWNVDENVLYSGGCLDCDATCNSYDKKPPVYSILHA